MGNERHIYCLIKKKSFKYLCAFFRKNVSNTITFDFYKEKVNMRQLKTEKMCFFFENPHLRDKECQINLTQNLFSIQK